MKFDITLFTFLLSLTVALSGWFARWRDKLKFEKQQDALERQQAIQKAETAAEKKVNDARNFNHLVNNQLQISEGIAIGFKDLEKLIRDLTKETLEIKSYLIRYGIAPEER